MEATDTVGFYLRIILISHFCKMFHPRCFTDSAYDSSGIVFKEYSQMLGRPFLKESKPMKSSPI